MGDKTGIEWTDATWNPVTGCSKVSQGCKHCYAERIFNRPYPGRDFTDVRTHPERLEWPLKWRGSKQAKSEGRPSRIFVNSMSDLFHEKVPDEFIDKVFAVMAMAKQHTFQVLTKRPERMRDWAREAFTEKGGLRIAEAGASLFDGTSANKRTLSLAEQAEISNQFEWREFSHVQWGVSVENQETADERVPILLKTPAAVRFISYEPALGPINISEYLACIYCRGIGSHRCDGSDSCNGSRLDWVIAGGESGPNARPSHPDWFRSVRDQCQAAGVPFFMKQITKNGRKMPLELWPDDLKIREFPNA